MAGRSVGSIEVTVDANTGKLVAQLAKEGRRAGKAFKTAAEQETRDIEATIEFDDQAVAKAKLLRKRIEAQLRGIELGFDTKELQTDLARIERQTEAMDLRLQLALNPGDAEKIAARLNEMTREQRRIFFDTEVDTAAVERELENIQFREWVADVEAHLDDLQYQADVARVAKEKKFADFIAKLDDKQFQLDVERVRQQRDLEIRVAGDMTAINRSLFEVRQRAFGPEGRLDISVGADVGPAIIDIKAMIAEMEATGTVNLQTEADLARARAALITFREFQEANAIEIPIKGDLDALDALLGSAETSLVSKMGAAGEKAGDSFGGGAGRGLSLRMKAIIGGIIALAEPAAVLLQGALAQATSVLSSAFSALGGAAGALPPILAAVGASVATLIIGFQGVGGAMSAVSSEFAASIAEGRAFNSNSKEIREAMASLTPAARGVVDAFAALQPQFTAIRRVVQENLFSGLGASLRSLGSDVLPQIGTGLAGLARSFNSFFKGLVADAKSIDFAAIFADLKPIVDSVLEAFRSLFRTIEPFLRAAAPAARMLADSFRDTAASIEDMVKAGAKSGNLTKFLVQGVESLREWGRLAKATGDALFTLFQAGTASGNSFVVSLTKMITRWDNWMESVAGQKALQKFFDTGRQLAEDLKPVMEGLKGFFENLISPGAIGRFGDFAESVGRVLPTLGSLFEIIGRAQILGTFADLLAAIAEAIDPIVPQLQRMADSVGEALGSALIAAIPLINLAASALGVLADMIGTLADTFNDLPGPIQTVVVALGTLFLLRNQIGSFGSAFLGLRDNIILLRPAFNDVGASMTSMFTSLKKLDFSAVDSQLRKLGPQLVQAAKSAGAAAGVAIGGALGIAFGATMVSQSKDMQGKVTGIMTIIGSAVAAFAAGGPIVGAVTLGLGAIGAAFQGSAQKAKDAAADVTGYAEALEDVAASGDATAVVTRVMDRLADQADVVADTFDDLGFSVGEWARGMADGTQDATDGMEDFVSSVGPAGEAVAEMLDKGIISAEELADTFKGVAQAGALPEGPIRDLGFALKDMGLDSRETGKIFDFLYDTGARLGQGQEELDQKVRLTGEGLAGLGPDAQTAADGMTEAELAADPVAAAFALVDQNAIDAGTSAADLGDEAGKLATDFGDLEDALGDIDITKVFSEAGTAAARFEGLRRKMEETAEAAGDMKSAFDLLIGTNLSVQEATSNVEQGIDDLAKIMEEGTGISGQLAATFDLTSQGGRDVAEAIREGVTNIGEWGEAMLAADKPAAEVTAGMLAMREQLIDAAAGFFATREEAAAFVDQAGLIPDNIALSVQVAGMQKALDDLTEFDRDLDGIPDTKDMTFNAPTIETIRAKAAELGVDISKIPDETVVEFFATNLRESLEGTELLSGNLDDLDGLHPDAEVTVRNVEAIEATRQAATALGNFEGSYGATLAVDDQVQPVLDPLTATLETYAGNTYAADITAVDEQARDAFNNAFTAGSTWNETVYKATIAASDEVQPVLDPATATLETYAGTTYEADIALKDAATPVVTPVKSDLEIYDARIYESEITLLDHTKPVMDPVLGALDIYDQRIYSADVIANAVQATEATGVAQGAVDRFGQTTAEADVAVTGADTAKTGADEVTTAVEGVGEATGEANVSIIGNAVVLIQLGLIGASLDALHKLHAKPQISLPDYAKVVSQLAALGTMMFSLDRMTADPRITLPTWFTAISQVGALSSAIRNIPDGSANITVTGVEGAISRVNALDAAIDRLQSKTITVTTRNVTTGGNMTGAIVPGSATGELIRSPTMRLVGERGYDEAIIPLQLPLNRIDPSVRDLAALLRGEGLKGLKPGPTKIINQYMTVNTVVQDPVAVATQVINRSAMLAHN